VLANRVRERGQSPSCAGNARSRKARRFDHCRRQSSAGYSTHAEHSRRNGERTCVRARPALAQRWIRPLMRGRDG
jgi:hypothetical protein